MIEKLTFGLFTQEDSRSFMRLMAYIRPYKVRIIFALIAILGVAATESYLAAFIAPWSTKASLRLPLRPNSTPQAASSPRCKTGKTNLPT